MKKFLFHLTLILTTFHVYAQFSYFSKPFSTGMQAFDVSAGGARTTGTSEGIVTFSNIDGNISFTSLDNFGNLKPACYDPVNPANCTPCYVTTTPFYSTNELIYMHDPTTPTLFKYNSYAHDIVELSSADGLIAICGSVEITKSPNLSEDMLIVIVDIHGKVYGSFHFGKTTHDEAAKAITLSDYINPTTGYRDIYINGEENVTNSNIKNALVSKFTFSFVGGVPSITEVWNSSITLPIAIHGPNSITSTDLIQSGNSIYCIGNANLFFNSYQAGVSFELDESTGNLVSPSNFNRIYGAGGVTINNLLTNVKSIKKINNDIYVGGYAYYTSDELDYMLIKFSGGSMAWEKLYDIGTGERDELASILVSNAGGADKIYMLGTTDFATSSTIPDKQCTIVCVDASGNVLTSNSSQYGTSGEEFAAELSEDVNQRFLTMYSTTNATSPAYDYVATNFSYSSPYSHTCFFNPINPINTLTVEGNFNEEFISQINRPLLNNGLCEEIGIVDEYPDCTSNYKTGKNKARSDLATQNNNQVKIVNNETLTAITNCYDETCFSIYNIYDFTGKLVLSSQYIKQTNDIYSIDISTLSKGHYIVHVFGPKNSSILKFYKN